MNNPSNKYFVRSLFIIAVLLLSVNIGYSQQHTGSIHGTVRTMDNVPVPFVTIAVVGTTKVLFRMSRANMIFRHCLPELIPCR